MVVIGARRHATLWDAWDPTWLRVGSTHHGGVPRTRTCIDPAVTVSEMTRIWYMH